MRDFKGMKRQRNRNRGGGGSGKPQQNANRAFDSNGPDGVKVRGAAQHIYEKYQQLARDATSSGDRVLAENYLQHAEHYFRVLRAMQPQRPVGEIIGRDQFASGYDIDFEDESQGAEGAESTDGEGEGGDNGRREDRSWNRDERPREEFRGRDDRPRDDFRPRQDQQDRSNYERPREDRSREDNRGRDENRQRDDNRARDDNRSNQDQRYRDDRPQRFNRDDRSSRQRDERPREDRPRDERPREDRAREDRPREDRGGQVRAERDPLTVVEPRATPLPAPVANVQPEEPRGGVLRSEDGGVSHAPAFLQVRPAEPRVEAQEPSAEPRRPRRRRAPASFETPDAAPATAEADEG
jgi:hypothetical protein